MVTLLMNIHSYFTHLYIMWRCPLVNQRGVNSDNTEISFSRFISTYTTTTTNFINKISTNVSNMKFHNSSFVNLHQGWEFSIDNDAHRFRKSLGHLENDTGVSLLDD